MALSTKEHSAKIKKPTETELLKRKDNFILIQVDYRTYWVFPYAEGIKALAALQNVEIYKEEYNEGNSIHPIKEDIIHKIISQQEYLDAKMTHLLKIDVRKEKDD